MLRTSLSLREYDAGALRNKVLPGAPSERRRVAPRARRRRSHDPAAVERRHDRDEFQRVGVQRARQRADRRLASASQCFDHGPFRLERWETNSRLMFARHTQ